MNDSEEYINNEIDFLEWKLNKYLKGLEEWYLLNVIIVSIKILI